MRLSSVRPLAPLMLLVALHSTGPASAQTPSGPLWTVCYQETSGGVGTSIAMFVFEPFLIARSKDTLDGIGAEFDKAVGVGSIIPGYTRFASFGSEHCRHFPTQADAQEYRDRWQRTKNYAIVKFIAWAPPPSITGLGTGSAKTAKVTGAAGGPGNPASKSGATVEKADTGIRDAGKAWDEQVRKALAEEARKKVETAAKTAQADAKKQAEVAAFFAERRKQGRAQ